MASTTQVQISNLFNLMVQIDPRIEMYHFGFRSDILKNIDNNFDQNNTKGRQFPHLHFDVPEYAEFTETADYYGTKENIQISLYFDALQDYQNDGSANTKNLIEQWADLKSIAQDFIINFKTVFCDKYQAGYFSFPRFEQMAYGKNDRLITWKVSFILTHVIPCTEEGNKIDTSLLPDNIEETDLENWKSQGPSPGRCATILGMLSTDDLLNCILPTYDFADVATQNATTAQQKLDLTNWLCAAPPTYENTHSLLFNGVSDYVEFPQTGDFDWQTSSTFTISAWIKISSYTARNTIYSKTSSPTFKGFWFRVDATTGRLFAFVAVAAASNSVRITSTNVVPLNTWTHVAWTYNGNGLASGMEFYIDGVQETKVIINDNLIGNAQTTDLGRIGATSDNAYHLNGYLTEFRVWNVAQNAAFISDDYNGGAPKEAQDKVNSIGLPRFGIDASWQDLFNNWRFMDESNTPIESFQTNTTIKAIRTTDVPI